MDPTSILATFPILPALVRNTASGYSQNGRLSGFEVGDVGGNKGATIMQLVGCKQEREDTQQDATYCFEMQGFYCYYEIYLKRVNY